LVLAPRNESEAKLAWPEQSGGNSVSRANETPEEAASFSRPNNP
jgi:hypothetical protein